VRIKNLTRINTRQIGALIREVAKRENFSDMEIDALDVRIKYRRRTHARPHTHPGGYAYYKTSIFSLSFVRDVQPDPAATANVIAHELAHCQGVHHGKAMNNTRYGWEEGWQQTWAWAWEYSLTYLPEPVKDRLTGVDRVEQKMKVCQAALDNWNRKLKLASTKVKKWKTKMKYYEKRMAAMPRKSFISKLGIGNVPDVKEN
jgi:hypothetical protein